VSLAVGSGTVLATHTQASCVLRKYARLFDSSRNEFDDMMHISYTHESAFKAAGSLPLMYNVAVAAGPGASSFAASASDNPDFSA
jgi:hypothetical protein